VADPIRVTISGTLTPCDFTLYQDPEHGPNSVIWTNATGSVATWTLSSAGDVLATQPPPNQSSPAASTYQIQPGATLQLWVNENFNVGNGVRKRYTISVNGNSVSCVAADPPDMQIVP
jgi:hypothetical protein